MYSVDHLQNFQGLFNIGSPFKLGRHSIAGGGGFSMPGSGPARSEALKDYPLEFLSRMIWNDIYRCSTWYLSWNLIGFNLPSCSLKQKHFTMQSGTHSNPSDSLARLYSRYWRHRRLEPSCYCSSQHIEGCIPTNAENDRKCCHYANFSSALWKDILKNEKHDPDRRLPPSRWVSRVFFWHMLKHFVTYRKYAILDGGINLNYLSIFL